MGQAQNTLGAAQGLLGMFTAARLGLHDPEGGRTDDERTFKNAIQMLVDDGDVLAGRGVWCGLTAITVVSFSNGKGRYGGAREVTRAQNL